MTPEQETHMEGNTVQFSMDYRRKYKSGQKEHGGNMWEMGAYQALEQMEQEVLDQWSYARQIRKCLDEIGERVEQEDKEDGRYLCCSDVKEILNRVKED